MVDDEAPRTRRPGRGTHAMGRVLGIPVFLNASMILLAVLVTVVYGNYVGDALGLVAPYTYLVGFGFVVCLLGSVLLHELGHALVAKHYGIGVRGITLELLGGWTEMEKDAPTPRIDALVSLAGPAVSLVIGGVATVATLVTPDRTVPDQIFFQLAASNILVSIFNVLPGLPLDGGRALRAGIWALLKDRDRATVAAGWAGRALAIACGLLSIYFYVTGGITLFGLAFLLLVIFTLYQGAGTSIRLARMTRRLPLVDLARLARPLLHVPAGTSLGEAQRRRAEDPRPGTVLAVTDSAGNLTALVDPVAAERVPVDRRPWVAVDTVARSRAAVPALRLGLTGRQVVDALQAHPAPQYLVTEEDEVIGVLRVGDVAGVLEPHRKRVTK